MNDENVLYKPKRKFFDNMRFLFGQMRKAGGLWTSVAAVVPNIISSIANVALIKLLVDAITKGAELRVLLIAVTAYTIINLFTLVAENVIDLKTRYDYLNRLRYRFLRKFIKKSMMTDYANVENPDGRKLSYNASAAIGNMSMGICQSYKYVYTAFSSIFGAASVGALLGFADPIVILACFLAGAVTTVLAAVEARLRAQARIQSTEMVRKIRYYSTTLSSEYEYAKDVRLYSMANWFKKTIDLFFADYRKIMVFYTKRYIGIAAGITAVMIFRDAAVFTVLISLCNRGVFTAGDFAFYYSAIRLFISWLSGVQDNITNFQTLHHQVDRLRDFLDMEDEEYPEDTAIPADDGYEVEFSDVHFSYDGEKDVLNGISFKAKKGEKIAIVGANGAGKTTCVKLLCGLYKPTGGKITINGVDTRNIPMKNQAHFFSAVFQDAFVLPASVEANITLQTPDKTDRKRIYECLVKAQLKKKIDSLPNGLDTKLNKELFKDAVEFSGGEMQRLFLARALYKDAPIIILDEPTAALDPIAENNMYLKYNEMTMNKTSFYISHRLASTGFCDKILYFEDGRITEIGTHNELMANNKGYADMYRTQSKYYKEKEDEEQ